jgi:hypothetical protein
MCLRWHGPKPKFGNGIIARGGAEERRIREDMAFGESGALTYQVAVCRQPFQ